MGRQNPEITHRGRNPPTRFQQPAETPATTPSAPLASVPTQQSAPGDSATTVAPAPLQNYAVVDTCASEREAAVVTTGSHYRVLVGSLFATIAHRWKLEGCDDADPGFWKTMEDLRDTRPKRLRPIVPDDPGNEEQLDSFTVKLSTGRATVALPDAVTDADLVALVRAILGRKR